MDDSRGDEVFLPRLKSLWKNQVLTAWSSNGADRCCRPPRADPTDKADPFLGAGILRRLIVGRHRSLESHK